MGYKAEVIWLIGIMLLQLISFCTPLSEMVLCYPQGEGFMVGVHINPVSGLPSGFQV